MIKVEHIETFNFEGAIRGMRNPMNSWDKSDTIKCYANRDCPGICKNNKCGMCIGKNDLDLMRRLCKGGEPHRKFMRQIFICMDITAPLYWWKEFDTYKIGVTANSCSTMHKIHSKKFEMDDFSPEHLYTDRLSAHCPKWTLEKQLEVLNFWRNRYLETRDKHDWWQMIQLLPSSYNQKRTITMNYENAVNMIEYRTGHKLDEWNEFVDILWELPYLKEIAGEAESEE